MKTNQRLLSADKIEYFNKVGKQRQEDKLIIECLYNKNTLQEYYLFEYAPQTQLAKCYTNNDFDKVETIDVRKMQKDKAMRYVLGFKKEKVSEIKESIKNKRIADEYYEVDKMKKQYSDVGKKEKAENKNNENVEQEFEKIRSSTELQVLDDSRYDEWDFSGR